jgi:hypothetical protein
VSSFDSSAISNGLFDAAGYEVVRTIEIPRAPILSILSNGPLVIDSIGETPVGAWIPGAGSKLILRRTRSTQSSAFKDEIIEDFTTRLSQRTFGENDWYKDPDVVGTFSIFDLLGPDLVAWSDAPLVFFGPKGTVFTTPETTPGEKLISAFVIKVPFALRTAIGSEEVPTSEASARTKSTYANKKVDRMLVEPAAGGLLKAELGETPQGSVDYSKLEKSISDHPTIVGRIPDGWMIFRKPPIPAFDGFNIFGQVRKIEFEAASGLHLTEES